MSQTKTSVIDWRSTDGPYAVADDHIVGAMAASDPNKSHGSWKLFIDYRGQEYPLNHIVGRAIEIGNDVELERYSFHSRRKGKRLVDELGFEVVEREVEA